MASFTIDRRAWFRGQGGAESKLLRQDGRMCCIGQVCGQLGVPRDSLLDAASVQDLPELERPRELCVDGRQEVEALWVCQAYSTNDSQSITDDDREEQLTQTFGVAGHHIEFVN